jgi:hypothetical protein
MGDSDSGGSGLGEVILAGLGIGATLLILGALAGGDKKQLTDGERKGLPSGNIDDADYTVIDAEAEERELQEKLDKLAPLRKSDPAEWFREIAKDSKLTHRVKEQLRREQELAVMHEQIRPAKPAGNRTGESKPREPWYEAMYREIIKVKDMFPREEEHGPIIEMIKRKYMEGEA